MQHGVLISNLALGAWPASLLAKYEGNTGQNTLCQIGITPMQVASISFYPGVARGAWKHAPIIPLPRCTALLQAPPPKFWIEPKAYPCS